MREIKFRGYDLELKQWHYGNYYFYTDTIYCVASDKDHEENEHHCILFDGFCDWNMPKPHYKSSVDKNSIGQFTGLTDKDGKEIYDGDILDAGDRIVLVSWNQPNGCWDSIFIRYTVPISQLTSNGITPVEWKFRAKVIGNKYNNPELLKN